MMTRDEMKHEADCLRLDYMEWKDGLFGSWTMCKYLNRHFPCFVIMPLWVFAIFTVLFLFASIKLVCAVY